MKYPLIVLFMTEERWALREDKLVDVLDFVRLKSSGMDFTAEEVEARITKAAERSVARAEGAVAIIPIRGVIANRMNMMSDFSGGTTNEGVSRAFQASINNDAVKAIVFDIDSPGGAVSGTEELSSMIFASRGRKPIISHVNGTAASAAYWIGSAADEMVTSPSAMVGSIGVFGVHSDFSAALDKAGIKVSLISAGKFKADGHPSQPLGDETRERMQGRVDSAYDMFVSAVSRNRGVSKSSVKGGFGQGDVVEAEPALAEGMIDGIATLDATLQRFGASIYPRQAPTSAKVDAKRFAIRRERAYLSLRH